MCSFVNVCILLISILNYKFELMTFFFLMRNMRNMHISITYSRASKLLLNKNYINKINYRITYLSFLVNIISQYAIKIS